ncbi:MULTISPECIES: AprI/Inh family metalloprotease inhibitor [Methylobacterium]|uniref:Alkaline proteinase inhibitor/ Outer membrane lipoprotein Omp19 domain-containing protein n=1 Tax=Methylobacterium jeotgali TaxID=381630 RepID=A0ABQ4SY25_9HYPH|nr:MULTISPECIES: AprI/Inh family metalloprotease inhibitor [Methylobacterium]PIU08266.1 MAG: hypothetical protein COT56_02050 [Methylobacterium sp. CG09_land_8_20_14_0_10_71_15]PIU12881.1 MAG: hypothetical protein COT28_13695 [Methylobacterium sp. CG08_land_8_20_14_0_20_71_15]GBU17526.1 hypothetical protein AwMethylo_17410 [Methylobacterium sp.]GJE07126.1 hypothetical protein AOPFMNJM_2450 [Methylobacterium jeotgali]
MPHPRRLAFAALALPFALLLAFSARAQVSPEIVKDSLGEWLIATDDGAPGCRVTLLPEKVGALYAARPAADCAARDKRLGQVSAWSPEDGIRLLDAKKRVVLAFREDETTLMKTLPDEGPTSMLVRAKPGVDRAPHAPALFGTWVLRRPDGPPLCEVTLLDKPPPGGEESFALTVGTCDASVKRLRLASWRVEGFELMLSGTGDGSLALVPTAQGFEKAEREGGKPLVMVRKT